MRSILQVLLALFLCFSFSAITQGQNPCNLPGCRCAADSWVGTNQSGNAMTGLDRPMGPINSWGGTATVAFNPQTNSSGDDVSHLDGVCSKPVGCECIHDPCGYNFSMTFKLSNVTIPAGATPRWGIGDPGSGTQTGGAFDQNPDGTWNLTYETQFIHFSLPCNTPDQPSEVVVYQKNPTVAFAKLSIHFACFDCANIVPVE